MMHTDIRKEMLNCFITFAIATDALKIVVSQCKPKVKIVDLCEKGDSFIRE
jgi:methionine aminopeptidase